MNLFDMALAIALLIAAYTGWKLKSLTLIGAGFVVALAPLVATLAGPFAAAWLRGFGLDADRAVSVGWLVVMLLAGFVIFMLFQLLSRAFKALMLGWLDRGFGAMILVSLVLIGALAAAPWLDASLRAMGQKKLTRDSLFLQKLAPLIHDI